MTTFALVNQSKSVTDDLNATAEALTKAINETFLPVWNPGATASVVVGATPGATQVLLVDQAPVANAEGYHEAPGGLADIVIQVPDVPSGQLSIVIAHELFETLADWLAILLVQGPWSSPVAYEVCDPVEDRAFQVDGVAVSNFVTPAWFVAGSKGPWDHLGVLTGPFTLTSGGYVALLDGTQTWGSDERKAMGILPWKRGAKRAQSAGSTGG